MEIDSSAVAAPTDFKMDAKPTIPNNPANLLRVMRFKVSSLRISSAASPATLGGNGWIDQKKFLNVRPLRGDARLVVC